MRGCMKWINLTLLVFCVLISGCEKQLPMPEKASVAYLEPLELSSFQGKKIGMNSGSIWEPLITNIAHAKPVFYTTLEESYVDLRNRVIEGVMTDLSIVKVYVNTPEGSDMSYCEVPINEFKTPMGAISIDSDLLQLFNEFLASIKADGTMDMLHDYWFDSSLNLVLPMPEIETSKIINRKIKVATIDATIPFSYYDGRGELKGYCIDLMRRFATKEHLEIEYIVVDFSGLIPIVLNKKANIAIANITITEERKKRVMFSEPIYYDQAGILALLEKE